METFKELLGIQTDFEAAYWVIAIAATFLFLLKFILSIIGNDSGDGDVDVDFSEGDIADGDFGDDANTGDSGHDDYISIDTILAFLKGVGWIGIICYRFTALNTGTILGIALASGIITFFFAFFIIKNLNKIESSGTMELKNAVGNVGTVYMHIPANGEGDGQIQVEIQGRLATVHAKSLNKELNTGDKALVCAIEKKSDIILVAPYPYEDKLK